MQPFLLSLERAERIIPFTLGRSNYQIHLSITTTRTSLGADARYDHFEYTSSANCGGKRTVHPAVLVASIRLDGASANPAHRKGAYIECDLAPQYLDWANSSFLP
jgi:hypothetical protein